MIKNRIKTRKRMRTRLRMRYRSRARRRRVFPFFRRAKLWAAFVGGRSAARLVRARSGARFGLSKHERAADVVHERTE